MKKRVFSLFVAAALLVSSFSMTAFAAQSSEDTLRSQYSYTNNGYTLEKVSHADVTAGEIDGFVDYYEYTDPSGKTCTGVTEHLYKDGADEATQDTAAELAKLKSMLESKYPDATKKQIKSMMDEIKASLTGDACQSYAFSALGYGDWVYIGTMYGGTGITKGNAKTMLKSLGLLKDETNDPDAAEYNQKMIDSFVGLLYGDNYYTEHPVPTQGVLFKMNVKTGESKIIMAGSVNGYQVTLRNAVEYNGRFYFIGTQVGTESVADAATGIPSIFEVNPEDDSFRTVYQAVTMDEYRQMQAAYVFPIPRAISVYKGSLIASVTQKDGAHIIAYTPDDDDFNADGSFKGIKVDGDSALRNPEFKEIAEQSEELLNYPAYHMYDANYGGTVYQMIEYNGKLYMAINAGQKALHSTLNPTEGKYTAVDPDTLEETKCYAGYAILEGSLKDGASPSDRDAWTWTPIIGNTDDDQWDDTVNHADVDPAMYTFNIDPNRFAAAICTMEVYNGYLYIGDYNDVTQATYPMLDMDFVHLATVLSQSVNLYRMDADYNIDLVVGDATKTFPDGSISGWESGYTGLNGHGSRINQYTSMTQIWDEDKTDDNDGVMLLGTLDEGSLLRPMVKITNGDVLKMDKDEWAEKISYLKVLIQLLLEKDSTEAPAGKALDEAAAEALVAQAIDDANEYESASGVSAAAKFALEDSEIAAQTPAAVTLTDEQKAELVAGIRDGSIVPGSLPEQDAAEALSMTYGMNILTGLVDANGQENVEIFSKAYAALVEYYQKLMEQGDVQFPEELQKVLDQLLTQENAKQLKALLTCLNAVKDSVVGCDTYAISTDSDGDNFKIDTVTLNGLGDDSNQTMRNFAVTDDYVVFIPGNAVRGGSVYRLADWPGKQEPTDYQITVTSEGNGTATADYTTATPGTEVTLTATPDAHYRLKEWQVVSGDVTIKDGKFTMPEGDVEIKAVFALKHPFTDVPDGAYYEDAVIWAVDNGVTNGTSATTFEPNNTCTRAQIVAFLWRAAGRPAPKSTEMPFTDVKKGCYYYNAVQWAVENGITKGTTATTFSPNETCNRAQAVTLLWRFQGSPEVKGECPFTDVPENRFFSDAVLWAAQERVTLGTTETTFEPYKSCTRAQIVTLLWREMTK